jgi:hypothetical protein
MASIFQTSERKQGSVERNPARVEAFFVKNINQNAKPIYKTGIIVIFAI